jgi:hypothetical protein
LSTIITRSSLILVLVLDLILVLSTKHEEIIFVNHLITTSKVIQSLQLLQLLVLVVSPLPLKINIIRRRRRPQQPRGKSFHIIILIIIILLLPPKNQRLQQENQNLCHLDLRLVHCPTCLETTCPTTAIAAAVVEDLQNDWDGILMGKRFTRAQQGTIPTTAAATAAAEV